MKSPTFCTKTGLASLSKTTLLVWMALALLALSACKKDSPAAIVMVTPTPEAQSKDTLLGSAVSPAHHPSSTAQDIEDYFDLAAAVGSHVVFITEWVDEVPNTTVTFLLGKAKEHDLAFHLYLSPIALSATRDSPAIPSSVTGTSFADSTVRQAFKAKALELAAMRPDLLGLGTEVNFLTSNASEFASYVTLFQEAVSVVKASYPSQKCAVSFQWDRMITSLDFAALTAFAGLPDVYAFTTYPGSYYGDPPLMPDAYYSSVRTLLPTQTLGFSEVGWVATDAASEATQAAFWTRVPSLMSGATPSFVSMSLLHDVTLFTGALESLNHTGLRYNDGTAKSAWSVVSQLVF